MTQDELATTLEALAARDKAIATAITELKAAIHNQPAIVTDAVAAAVASLTAATSTLEATVAPAPEVPAEAEAPVEAPMEAPATQ